MAPFRFPVQPSQEGYPKTKHPPTRAHPKGILAMFRSRSKARLGVQRQSRILALRCAKSPRCNGFPLGILEKTDWPLRLAKVSSHILGRGCAGLSFLTNPLASGRFGCVCVCALVFLREPPNWWNFLGISL